MSFDDRLLTDVERVRRPPGLDSLLAEHGAVDQLQLMNRVRWPVALMLR
jgi:hypothetical protein